MALDSLLGNEQLKTKLAPALAQNRLSHAYLIAGPAGSGKHVLARLLAAAMQCSAEQERPCCVCAQCRKVLGGTHPDVITVDDTEHKNVSVRVVREAREDVFIRPNEGRRKIYVFPRAADMGAPGQNALLKILEEPPAYGAFLLLTDSAQKLLPTIRSRCVELQLAPLSRETGLAALREAHPQTPQQALEAAWLRSGGWYGQAEALLEADGTLQPQTVRFAEVFAERDAVGLTELLVPMERFKRDRAQEIFTEWLELLGAALEARSGLPAGSPEAARIARARTGAELVSAMRRLQQVLTDLQANVSVGTLCGALQVFLR